MNSTTLRVLAGWTLVVAALACIAGGLLHPVVDGHAHSAEAITSPHEAIGTSLLLIGTVLLLLALPFVYGALVDPLGRLGLVGFVLYFVGNLLSAVPHLVVMAFVAPEVARRSPGLISDHDLIIDSGPFAAEQVVSGLGLLAGLLVLGIAAVRADGIPAWIGWCGIAGTVLALAPLPVLPVVTGLQIEVLRGVMAAALGVHVARSAVPVVRSRTARAEPALERDRDRDRDRDRV